MLPSIAASSSGHWNHDASRRWQRSMRPAGVDPQPDQHVAAERLDQRHAFARRRSARSRPRTSPCRQPVQHLFDQRQALLDLLDADPDARIDVALGQHRHFEAQLRHMADSRSTCAHRSRGPKRGRHSRRRRSGAQDRRTGCRCPRCDPAATRSRRRAPPAQESARVSHRSARGWPHAPSAGRSTATPPGTMQSIIRRWPKQRGGAAQHALAQHAAMRQHDAERCIVADRAEIAEVVGDPLQLRHHAAQPYARAAAARCRAPLPRRGRRRMHRRPRCRPTCGRQAARPAAASRRAAGASMPLCT